MALLTVSKESALLEAGNSALMSGVFHGLAGNFCLCACVLHAVWHSLLTVSAEIWRLHSEWRMVIVSAELSGKQSHEIGPRR